MNGPQIHETVRAGFHSRYAPMREAERFVEAKLEGRTPSLVFVLGGGLNYIGDAIEKRLPGAYIALIQPCNDFDGRVLGTRHAYWSPGSDRALGAAISDAFHEGRGAGGVAVIEWEPVLSRFPQEAAEIRGQLAAALEREAGDAATRSFWARRWLRNSLAFARSVRATAALAPGTADLVLACAGPGLASALPAIAAARDGIALWCLASAHQCLQAHGLEPDCVIATDPGHWNSLHLRAATRSRAILALPPSARVPASLLSGASAIAPFSTGMSFESGCMDAVGMGYGYASASGSAAGTALSLAAGATSGTIWLCGFDLAALGLREHASAYAFDALDEAGADRLDGALSRRYDRVLERYPARLGGWRLSRAFSSYADSTLVPAGAAGRCFRLSASPVETAIPRPETGRDAIGSGAGTAKPGFVAGPACLPTEDRRPLLAEFLGSLASLAETEIDAALESRRPIDPERCLSLWALAGKSAAPLVAQAARGRAGLAEREKALAGMQEGLADMIGSLT